MTDAMKAIIGSGSRYIDWISGKAPKKDNRTGDEINRELCEKFGWEVSG